MKIAMITDIHFGCRQDSPLFLEYMLRFYDEIFFPYLESSDISTVFILGDTFDKRKYINLNTLHSAKTHFFDKLKPYSVFMIYGNHDVYHRNTNEVNSVDPVVGIYPNIRVIPDHDIIDFDGTRIGFISWINSSNLEDSIRFIDSADCSILCGHFEIKSFEMVKGNVCEHGFDKNMFTRYDKVFSGHFHVISDDRRISYLGNPHQLTWADYGLKKGFWIYDTQTEVAKLVENPLTLFEKINYSDDIDLLKFDYSLYENKIVRIMIPNMDSVNKNKLNLLVEKLGSLAHSIDIHESQYSTLGELVDEVDVCNGNMMQIMNQYITSIDMGNNTLNREKLRNIFMTLYSDAFERMV